ncbi:uncharacterized protein LOC107019617 [Solanum pennellii]|uniref:Uncharacterized protein LOC107019617 n=1 Tax=Solanum pennellii TaxID=28526 RepID=A0ABM1GSY5_SOLPN|nr:uncharacterized protein LOC107019617 [Solanum pennellii]
MNAKQTVEQVQQVQSKSKGMIRQLYCHMKEDQQRPVWNCLIFNNAARPKAYFTMWIMMNQRLVTVDRLAQWGVVVDKTCVLCKNVDENAEHLFMQCNLARRLWGRLLSWIEQQSNVPMTWEQFLQWCIQQGKGKSSAAQVFKIILTEGIYGLWMERNSRIFEHKSKNEDHIVKEIAYVTIVRTPSRMKEIVSQWTFKQ